MWEIPALAVLMELHSRAVTKGLAKFELQVLYARAMTRVWEKIGRLKLLPDVRIADFGTRRRHGFLWQDWCVQAMIEGLGPAFLGTSNCLIAMRREVEAIGTNAHELPMVYSALADNDRELAEAPYKVLADWQQDYDGNLRVMLPDTFGTPQFPGAGPRLGHRLDRHPHRLPATPSRAARWPSTGGARRKQDPREKLLIFSDGLDVDAIERIHRHFHGRVRIGFGWGTLLTNDFRGLGPDGRLDPFSIVCKVVSANGRPAVKLSDNPDEGHGPGRGDRALPPRVPGRRADEPAGGGLSAPAHRPCDGSPVARSRIMTISTIQRHARSRNAAAQHKVWLGPAGGAT